jgi:hypothetical protein
MKPSAPEQIRGEFRPIRTSVAGTLICEHLPRLAGLAHRFALVRSMTHRLSNHNPAGYYTLTGVPPATGDAFDIRPAAGDHPGVGATVSRYRPTEDAGLSFVQLAPPVVGDLAIPMPGQGAGFLGSAYDPLRVSADASAADFAVDALALPDDVDEVRFGRRRGLLATVERARARLDQAPARGRWDTYTRRAVELITAPQVRRAFLLHQESTRLRERYGQHRHGQALLLARRLIEAGVRLVTVYWGGPLNSPDDFWDTHRDNIQKLRRRLLPAFDQCLSALLDDLHARGLLDTTLVVSLSEFGRTPRLGQVTGDNGTDRTGRDHWPQCYSVLLSGGGVRGGAIIGRSDRFAAFPAERATAPEDLLATIYQALGVPRDTELTDPLGRPLPLTRGEPVGELFG